MKVKILLLHATQYRYRIFIVSQMALQAVYWNF